MWQTLNLILLNILIGKFVYTDETPGCGIQIVNNNKSILKSNNAEINEFPWLVLLRYEDGNGTNAGYRCLGVLVSQKAIVTSAGCVEPKEVVLKGVRLGEYNLATDPDCVDNGDKKECADTVKDVGVDKKIVHDNFNLITRDNDIAVVVLNKEVEFSDTIQPICLPESESQPKSGDTVVASGWGRSSNGELITVKKRVVSIIQKNEDCQNDYSETSKIVTDNNICTKEVENSTHFTCAGDSGGPLMKAVDNTWSVIGVTSFGIGCGNTFADGNTKVSNYVDWIKKHI